MTERCRICIIGGGIAGVSTAYHLAERGETDVVVLERAELTSGSTWHAAGNLPHFAGSLNLMKIHRQTKLLYRKLREKHGDIGMHLTGSVRLAHDQDRVDEFKRIAGTARQISFDFEVLTPDEIKARWPFIKTDDILAGLWDPEDGHIDPTSVTNAMAQDARAAGVVIKRNNPVTSIERKGKTWHVEAANGVVEADILVNAAGFRAGEVAAMVGHTVPIAMMEHQYLVTDDIPELQQRSDEIPMVRDPDHGFSYYLRQERKGVLIGPYEHEGKLWAQNGVDPSFGQELLAPDLDRIAEHVGLAMERVPLAAEAGIKTIVNGPITYTPDGLPLVGPAHGIEDYILHCGSSFGITQSGGTGKACAEWILDGQSELDLWEMDPRRFGDFATKAWTEARCKDIYDNEYAAAFPNEWASRSAGRPQRKTPIHDQQVQKGATMVSGFGWERPAFFAADRVSRPDDFSFRREKWYADVAAECLAVTESVGLLDLSPFAKFDITGPGAEAFLNGIGANQMAKKEGGIVLTHALSAAGGVVSEFSVTRLDDQRFYAVSAAAAEKHDSDVLHAGLPTDGSVKIENLTADWGTLVLCGPNARKVLEKLTNQDLSNAAFRWLTGQSIQVAGIDVRALRVNFVGELGWELHHKFSDQVALYNAVMQAGEEYDITQFGLRAMDSLRLEKMYRGWRNDLTTEYSLLEAGMSRFYRPNKVEFFIGKDALARETEDGAAKHFVCLEIDANGADCISAEPVLDSGGKTIGLTTSGGFGHRTGKSLAMAYIDSEQARAGNEVSVQILQEKRPALVHLDAIFDPDNNRLRA